MTGSDHEIVFQTERLFVRPYTMDDLDNFFRLNGDKEVMRYIRPAQTFEQSKEFLLKIILAYAQRPGTGRWGMFSHNDQEFVGSFALIPVEGSDRLQLGYAILKENWGKGWASEAIRGGIQYAFLHLKLTEIAAITYPENLPSQKLLLKNGFVFEKTFREEDKDLSLYLLRRHEL